MGTVPCCGWSGTPRQGFRPARRSSCGWNCPRRSCCCCRGNRAAALPLTDSISLFPAALRPEIETVEKAAYQFIEIDKPLFRESKHARRDSIPCGKVVPPCVRGVISDVHAAGNDGFNFIPAAAAAGTPCGRAFSTNCISGRSAAGNFFHFFISALRPFGLHESSKRINLHFLPPHLILSPASPLLLVSPFSSFLF